MRRVFLAVAVLCALQFSSSRSEAAFMSGGTTNFTNGSNSVVADVTWEVWGAGATNYGGITINTGEYGYFYQIVNNSAAQKIETFVIDSSGFSAAPSSIGGQELGSVASIATVAPAANPFSPARPGAMGDNGAELYWNFSYNSALGLKPGQVSDILYFTSTGGPGAGSAFLVNPATATGTVPTPVPVPPALALLLVGAPCASLLRKRFSRA